MKKIVLITRTWNNEEIKSFIERIYTSLSKIIVLVNCEKEKDLFTQTLLNKCQIPIINKLEIINVRPWGIASGAFNIGLTKAFNFKPDYILIASPEVELKKDNVDKMAKILSNNNKMLVVGYALRTNLPELGDLEKGHYIGTNKGVSDALKVPWNTCAMWNAKLFLENVRAFHIICDCSKYLGKDKETGKELRGMEDALAIALAQKKDCELKAGLIKNYLNWKVSVGKIDNHKEKMKRKCSVYKKYQDIFKFSKSINIEKLVEE